MTATEGFKKYFAALDVFAQCDPIHAGTIWGGIRVIVEVRGHSVQDEELFRLN